MRLSALATPRTAFNFLILALCAAVPVLAPALGEPDPLHPEEEGSEDEPGTK